MEQKIQEMNKMLIDFVSSKLKENNLEDLDTKELGDVIDMIKDLCEARYYCLNTK